MITEKREILLICAARADAAYLQYRAKMLESGRRKRMLTLEKWKEKWAAKNTETKTHWIAWPIGREEEKLYYGHRAAAERDFARSEIKELEPLAEKGRNMVNAQAQRRQSWQDKRRIEWDSWQKWIDGKIKSSGWSFEFAQRRAAEHFTVSLKSIKRRTKERRTG